MRRAIDSPWLWLALFCGFGLVVLVMAEDRLERRLRQQAILPSTAKSTIGGTSETLLASDKRVVLDASGRLFPLQLILGTATIVGLILFSFTTLRQRAAPGRASSKPCSSDM